MTTLSDSMVLEPMASKAAEVEEEQRRIRVHFEKNAREIVGVQVVQSDVPLNPLRDMLRQLALH